MGLVVASSDTSLKVFREKLDEIRKLIDEDQYRRRVLLLCQQEEPKSFEDYSLSGSFRRLEKFESSTYSEVLKAIDMADNNKTVVMKIMRALSKKVMKMVPYSASRGCQSYNDILNELVVVQSLSQLHNGVVINGKSLFKIPFFCLIYEIKVVNGNLDRVLSKSDPKHKKGAQKKQDDTVKEQDSKEDDTSALSETDRMLIEALPQEYVVSVMKHDGQPLWWMMTHKKLTPEQLASTLVQVIVGLAIAERVYSYEHRDLHVSNILIKKTPKNSIPFVLDNNRYKIVSHGVKATIIDATFSRLAHKGKVYYRDLTSTLRAYGSRKAPSRMSLQNRSYREMVNLTKNNWEGFTPKTNLIWLTYLCETLMKNDVLKGNERLHDEVRKIRDTTLKAKNTYELLGFFPFEREKAIKSTTTGAMVKSASSYSSSGMQTFTSSKERSSGKQLPSGTGSEGPVKVTTSSNELKPKTLTPRKSHYRVVVKPHRRRGPDQQRNEAKKYDSTPQGARPLTSNNQMTVTTQTSSSSVGQRSQMDRSKQPTVAKGTVKGVAKKAEKK